MRFSLIGGSGGLGSILADRLLLAGHETSSWSRSAKRSTDVLDPDLPREAFEADRMVYLAWSTRDRSPEVQDRHADAAVRWSARAAAEGIPFVFVSSVLAASLSGSEYGRAKLAAERGIRDQRGHSVRVGLVVDDGYPELLASRLRRLALRVPAASRLGAWQVLPVSGASAAGTILSESSADGADIPVLAAERTAVRLSTIMSGGSDVPVSRWASGLVTGLAKRYPTSRGPIGRHVDALRGLALTSIELDGTRDPRSGPIEPGDWRRGIIPTRGG